MRSDRSGRLGCLAAVYVVSLGAAAILGSCVPREFPRELFTIAADGADYPVMLSQTPTSPHARGRKILGSSGTQAVESRSSYISGGTTVTVGIFHAGQSELPASTQMTGQVQRADRWLQIDRAEFSSENFAAYGRSSAVRRLVIEGTVYR